MITDGRFSGASAGPCVGHVSPESAELGPIAAVRNGDKVTIDIPGRSIELHLSSQEIETRLMETVARIHKVPSGFMRHYVEQVTSAAKGAYLT